MNGNEATVFVNYEKDDKGSLELERAYMELGKAYYEGKFEDPLPALLPLFDRITRIKEAGAAAPGMCPGCGNPLKPEAAFCGQCGYKVRI